MSQQIKSTITCDLEGIIETYNEGAQTLFQYQPEEVVGKKRVSLFSPGWVVLQNVNGWLKQACEKGEYETNTQFIRKDSSRFNAHIRITPTFKEGKQIGYCGVTTQLEEEVAVEKKWWTPLVEALVITRAPFLSTSIIPAFIGAAYTSTVVDGPVFSSFNFILATIGVVLLHLSANVFNDYFDWTSGTDPANTHYFLKYSGGSRAIELGLITERGTRNLATAFLALSALIGVYLTAVVGWGVLAFGLAGAFFGFFYTSPPLRISARRGLGEMAIGITFGPLITGGIFYVVTGMFSWTSILVGLPIGLLIANILLINEVPDVEPDGKTGKNHLVVTFGKENAVTIYTLAVIAAGGISLAIAFQLERIWLTLPVVLLAMYASFIIKHFRTYLHTRQLVTANVNTINLAIVFGVVFTVCLMV